MFRGKGTLHYSPQLLGCNASKWWIILWCDKSIVKYYRHLYYIHHYQCKRLLRPAWDAHITLVRDEEPPEDRKALWGLYQDTEFEFEYSGNVGTNGEYWWLPVMSDPLLELREELGLSRTPRYDLHLSFGHIDENF